MEAPQATPKFKPIRPVRVWGEVLPAVFDAEEAMKPEAPQLYEAYPGNIVTPGTPFFGPRSLKELVMGDAEKGLTEADVVTEGTFAYENLPNPIPPEPPGAIALWEGPNKVTLWVSNQASYMDTVTAVQGRWPFCRRTGRMPGS